MSANILIVEDDENLRVALRDNLVAAGHSVQVAHDASSAEALRRGHKVELVVLDVMLPGEDGYRYCARLRREGCRAPVLMLTARSLEEDIVKGFDAGADDYLIKPYRLRELLARVTALLRRGVPAGERVAFGEYVLDASSRTVTRAGLPIELTRTEFDLLAYFLRNVDRALRREELLDAVWGDGVTVEPKTVDNFVSSLKRKLKWTAQSPFAFHALRGVGYRLVVPAMTER